MLNTFPRKKHTIIYISSLLWFIVPSTLKFQYFKVRFLYPGCITADELKFVLTHLPGKVTYKEIDEMIKTVDKNGDGKINYSEFRVMMGAHPLILNM